MLIVKNIEVDATAAAPIPLIEINQGEVVQWHFHQVPASTHLAYIYFHPLASQSPGERPFGPFHYLEPSSQHSVFGIGNSGIATTYTYSALLLDAQGRLATTSPLTGQIVNHSNHPDTSPYARVRFVPGTAGSRPTFHVEPTNLSVPKGGTATWQIEDVPENHFITLHFGSEADHLQGPFASLSVSRATDSSSAWLISAMNLQSHQGSLGYQIHLRSADGSIIPTEPHDPTIEPLPPPPNTGP